MGKDAGPFPARPRVEAALCGPARHEPGTEIVAPSRAGEGSAEPLYGHPVIREGCRRAGFPLSGITLCGAELLRLSGHRSPYAAPSAKSPTKAYLVQIRAEDAGSCHHA